MQVKTGNKEFSLGTKLPDLNPIIEDPTEDALVAAVPTAGTQDNTGSLMWTDRYKPKQFRDLVGNQGVISQLYEWLKDWDDVVIRGHKKEVKFRGNW